MGCPFCQKPFTSKKKMKKHKRSCKDNKLKLHLKEKSPEAKKAAEDIKAKRKEKAATPEGKAQREKNGPKKDNCPHCNVTFESKGKMRRHKKSCTKKHKGAIQSKELKCTVPGCEKPFASKNKLHK